MAEPARARITPTAWVRGRPSGEFYELAASEIVAVAPKRLAHALIKGPLFRSLARASGAACATCLDGIAMEVNSATIYEPNALARREAPVSDTPSCCQPSD